MSLSKWYRRSVPQRETPSPLDDENTLGASEPRPGGVAWGERETNPRQPAVPPPDAPEKPRESAAPSATRRSQPPSGIKRGGITGEVRDFRERTDMEGVSVFTTWAFRLERYDEAGNRLPPVPVEMRGLKFTGSISEGDWVFVRGSWTPGKPMHVPSVENLTTGTTVAAIIPASFRIASGCSWLIFLAFIAGVIAVVIAISNG